MKFRIGNLGVIKMMEVDMSKPFILFSGNNGTGKTYATSFLYSFVWILGSFFFDGYKKKNYSLPVSDVSNNDEIGQLDPDVIYDQLSSLLLDRKTEILDFLNLNIDESAFVCSILTTKEEWYTEMLNKEVNYIGNSGISKKRGTFEYTFHNKPLLSDSYDESFLFTVFMLSLFFDGINGAHMFTAERNGIYTFSKEISQSRLRFPEIGRDFSYPRPVADGLANAENLSTYKKTLSQYNDLADEIETIILHGKLLISDEGDISFQKNDKQLTLNQVSSTIKTLAPLVFYLRHMADNHNLLLIDEPEINLHPDNQVLLARVFVKMVNSGIRLIISTHSDYLIREINNMIMAWSLNTNKGYTFDNDKTYSDSSLQLNKDRFSAYYFTLDQEERAVVSQLDVDDFGINMPSIDRTIEEQNERTNLLYDTLKYGC